MSGAEALATGSQQSRTGRRPGSLVSPFLRHGLILVAAAVVSHALALYAPIQQLPMTWLVAAALLGALAGLIGRSWLGVVFVIVGWVVGLVLELHWRLGAGPAATQELSEAGITHLAALVILALTYTAGALLLAFVGRRRRATEPAADRQHVPEE